MAGCPNCGQANPDGFRLCGMCGTSLTAPPEGREERKVVTVLFCDLVGFTAQAERLDPEDVRALLRPYLARLRTELERHGGTVEKFIGDAVMALFGAPVAHEDDPERAVRAALAIRDWAAAQDALRIRIAVTTGEALIRLDAHPEAGEGMASGDVVNTASRLQAAAPVNGILVDESTYRATRHAIDYAAADTVDAKGKAQPIAVWVASSARSRFGVDVTHHARAELVGRERELSVLRDAFERARDEGTPQLVTLVAVPGMGKSRLVYELSRIVDADPELVTWRQGRCLAYGDGVAFWALAEVVKAQAGILERDTEVEAAEKLQASVERAIGDPGDARWVESHLRPLVGLETETGLGGDRRGEAFAAWRRFIEAIAEERPLVLVLEDLHWADEGLLDFVDELVDWLSGVPLLVVCSARPELLERRPGWGGGKLNASTIGLSPLSSRQSALLISHLLERTLLPAETQRALLERSEGNPLYAEQFAQLYLERGSAEDLPLPETLQGIVAARLDGLSADEKAVLHDAAVVGKVFWTGALHREEGVSTALLHSLERKGFLTRQRRSSVASEGEWSFAHMLLRDVAYGQIPRAERAQKHRLTAEWIESLGRTEDQAELLAFHWSSALELARAAGQDTTGLETPARLALRAAGDRAASVNAYPAAAAYFEGALGLWPEHDVERPAVQYGYANALYRADDERAVAALESARDAVLAAGDRLTAAEAEVALSRIWWHRAKADESDEHQRRAAELAGDAPSPTAARVLATIARGRVGSAPAEALRIAHQALALAEQFGDLELQAHAIDTIGMAKGAMGDLTGIEDEKRALELAIAANSPIAGAAANNVAINSYLAMDFPRAARLFAEAESIAKRFGDGSMTRWLRAQRVTDAAVLGDWDTAIRAADAFAEESDAGTSHQLEPEVRAFRGRIREARGDIDGAISDYLRGLALARDTRAPSFLLPALATIVVAFEAHGSRVPTDGPGREIDDLVRELLDLARAAPHEAIWTLGFEFFFSRTALAHDAVLREVIAAAPAWPWKELATACLDRDFVRAADMWATGGSPPWEARLRLRAAEELIESGRRPEGEVQLAQSLAFYRSVGATFYLERGETLLAKTA